jgi:hypothetical protein
MGKRRDNFSLVLEFHGDPRTWSSPTAQIVLESYGRTAAGRLWLSTECWTQIAFEQEIDRLRAELDEVERQGRERFADYHAREERARRDRSTNEGDE